MPQQDSNKLDTTPDNDRQSGHPATVSSIRNQTPSEPEDRTAMELALGRY